MARSVKNDDRVTQKSGVVRRYFFDVDEGGEHCADQVGVFLSPEDVEKEALDYVVDIARLEGKSGRMRMLSVAVRNDRGQLVIAAELSLKLTK